MLKQILYPSFSSRIFAGLMDTTIISLLSLPFISNIHHYVLVTVFSDYFIDAEIDVSNREAMNALIHSTDFLNFLAREGYHQALQVSLISVLLNLFFIIAYYLISIRYFGNTIGKILIRAKIVDADNFQTPTTMQLVKRCLWAWGSVISILFVPFNSKKMALHDRMTNTIVIKI